MRNMVYLKPNFFLERGGGGEIIPIFLHFTKHDK